MTVEEELVTKFMKGQLGVARDATDRTIDKNMKLLGDAATSLGKDGYDLGWVEPLFGVAENCFELAKQLTSIALSTFSNLDFEEGET